MRQNYMIDGMTPTGAAWGVAATGIFGWIARIAAIVIGVAFLIGTCVISIPIFVLAYPVHLVRRRARRPLTWIGSWTTTVIAASILMCAGIGYLLLQHDKTGATEWQQVMASANQPSANPPPPPRFLRYFPGATSGYHPHSPGFTATVMLITFVIMAEMVGAFFGSIVWGAAWLVVSGWTGRLAGVHGVVDDPHAPT